MEHRTLTEPQRHESARLIDPRADFNTQLATIALTPILALWPLLSTLPLFGLLGGPESIGWGVMYLFLLITGFWGVFGGWLALRFVRPSTVPARPSVLPRGRLGLLVGAYATAWTVVAMGVVILT
ncbi:MAG: hypothetical protein ACFE0R_06960 [Salinarimonas sp.]